MSFELKNIDSKLDTDPMELRVIFAYVPGSELDELSKKGVYIEISELLASEVYIKTHIKDFIKIY